jgi:hypothetical protein
MVTDIIKGDMAQAIFQSDEFLYLEVKDVLSDIAGAVNEAESLLSSSGTYNQHFATIMLCCALDDIAKLALLGAPFGETKLKFSSLKHRPERDKSWEHTEDLLHVIESDKSRLRSLRGLYYYRNNEVAHTCVPFNNNRLTKDLGYVKSLAKDIDNYLELATVRGGN